MTDRIDDEHQNLSFLVRKCQVSEPGISEKIIIDEILALAGTKALTRFVRELKAKPDLLTSGRSDASPTAQKFIRRLRALGFTVFQRSQCSSCGREMNLPHKDGNGGKHCSTCSQNARNKACTECGQKRAGGHRVLDGSPYCRRCFRKDPRSHETCIVCGNLGVPEVRMETGPICDCCYAPPADSCDCCGNERPILSRKHNQSLCSVCYQTLNRQPRPCSSCGAHRICPQLTPTGPMCAQCAGIDELGSCSNCGAVDRRLNGRKCIQCIVPEKLRLLISDYEGKPHSQLLKLERYLLMDVARYEAVLSWIQKSPMSKAVREMALGKIPITLRAVAENLAPGACGYLAALLIESDVVADENFERVRFEVWQNEFFISIADSETRSLIRRYTAWVLNPQFRQTYDLGGASDFGLLSRSKTHLSVILTFLDTISAKGVALNTLPQRVFDSYVADLGHAGRELTPFIRWARTQHLTTIRSHYIQRGLCGTVASEEQRWEWVKELLTNESLQLAPRIVGLLALLYGLTVTHLVALPRGSVDMTNQTITFGSDPIKIPDAVFSMVQQLIIIRPSERWLFKGMRPGRHLSTVSVSAPLNQLGINLRMGKSAALISLSREVPPSILADLTGLSVYAVSRWSDLSGRDWVDYPGLRLST